MGPCVLLLFPPLSGRTRVDTKQRARHVLSSSFDGVRPISLYKGLGKAVLYQ